MIPRRITTIIIALAVVALAAPFAWADPTEPLSLADMQSGSSEENARLPDESASVEWEKPLPISLAVEYTLVSDYIFRGINFSEYDREGRERPNHQLLTSISLDLAPLWGRPSGECGEIGFDAWFEWYAGQKSINPTTDDNLQEIDYTIWYAYQLEQIATEIKLGWIAYVFPNVVDVGDNDRTHEWFLSLSHNDAWAWRWAGYQGEDGILNPWLTFYHDMHISRGCWIDMGINHPFELAKNLTLTPSYTLSIDAGWMGPFAVDAHGSDDHSTRIAGMTYGLDLTYDLTEVLQLPPEAGSLAVSGFINWWDPTSQIRHYGPLLGTQDELYGGLKVAWSW